MMPGEVETFQQSDLDIFESPYYIHSNIFLRIFGQWPYQIGVMKYFYRLFIGLVISSLFVPNICKMIEQRHNVGIVIMGMPSFLYYVEFISKYVCFTIKQKEVESILDKIKDDFHLQKNKNLEILHKYSEEARKFNTVYMVYVSTVVVVYSTSDWVPQILDFLIPLNESRPKSIPRLVKYNMNAIDDNFNFIVMHGLIIDSVVAIFYLGFDTLFISCAQHACALFKIVINEAEDCLKEKQKVEDNTKHTSKIETDEFYDRIVKVINLHKHALEFTELVDSTYTIINLLIIGIALITISLTEFEAVIHMKDTGLMLRFSFFTVGELLHVLYCNWPGQRVMDHSLLVYTTCYTSEWYREDISNKSKKLLILMMVRSQASAHLTAGKMYYLGSENFAKILKASMSFFTMLLSVH